MPSARGTSAVPTMGECPTCKASVAPGDMAAHLAWHATLRERLGPLVGLGVNVNGL